MTRNFASLSVFILIITACQQPRSDRPEDSDTETGRPHTGAPDSGESASTDDSGDDTAGDTAPAGTDADGDGYPAPEDCDDADPSTWPGAPTGCDGGDHDCDGLADVPVDCRPTGDLLVSDAYTTFVPDGAGYRLGGFLAGVGDVDGDGRDDFLIGSPRAGAGVVSWFFGITDPGEWDMSRHLHNEGDYSDAEMPTVLAPGGDLNGDGRAEVLLGIPEGGSTGDGVVEAWYTEGTRQQIRILAQLGRSGSPCTRLGAALGGGATDLDGDGQDDLVTGDDACTTVAILPGPMQYWEAHALDDATLVLGDVGAIFASPGDVDGDGYDDLVLDAGGTVIFAAGPFLADSIPGGTELDTSDSPLRALSPAGDTDGDGRAEWLARRGDGSCWIGGAFPGGIADFSTAAYPLGTGADSCSLAVSAGDVDGDTLDDVLLVASGLDAGAANAGGAWLLYGPVDGARDATTDAQARFLGDETSMGLSNAAAAGDVDADGSGDILLGESGADQWGTDAGAAWLFRGSSE